MNNNNFEELVQNIIYEIKPDPLSTSTKLHEYCYTGEEFRSTFNNSIFKSNGSTAYATYNPFFVSKKISYYYTNNAFWAVDAVRSVHDLKDLLQNRTYLQGYGGGLGYPDFDLELSGNYNARQGISIFFVLWTQEYDHMDFNQCISIGSFQQLSNDAGPSISYTNVGGNQNSAIQRCLFTEYMDDNNKIQSKLLIKQRNNSSTSYSRTLNVTYSQNQDIFIDRLHFQFRFLPNDESTYIETTGSTTLCQFLIPYFAVYKHKVEPDKLESTLDYLSGGNILITTG